MSELPRSLLGRTGLEVTARGFGAMELATSAVSDADSEHLQNAVLEAPAEHTS